MAISRWNYIRTRVDFKTFKPYIIFLDVEKQYLLEMKHQYARNWVENHLETEKHILRQIQGNIIIHIKYWSDYLVDKDY